MLYAASSPKWDVKHGVLFTQSKPLKDLRVAWAVTQKQSTLNVTGRMRDGWETDEPLSGVYQFLRRRQTDGEQLDRSTEQTR